MCLDKAEGCLGLPTILLLFPVLSIEFPIGISWVTAEPLGLPFYTGFRLVVITFVGCSLALALLGLQSPFLRSSGLVVLLLKSNSIGAQTTVSNG